VDWSHLGLDRQPFRAAVDPDSYFPSPSHEAALSAVAAAFSRRDPVVLLDGAPGVGKSLVARKWLEHLLPDVPRVVVPSARAERPAELLQAVLFDLGKPYQGLTEQELRLAATGHLLDLAVETGYPTVLVLDEAQHLGQTALEELRLLGNLETRGGIAVVALLVAQPALREVLRQPASGLFAQRVAAQVALEPLTADESVEYLRHQLRAAGGEPAAVFDGETTALLAGACGGIPRVLNRAATLALELAATAEAKVVDVEAALEALDRLGLQADAETPDTADPVLLPHPARTAEPNGVRRGKPVGGNDEDEGAGRRGPKEKTARKRTA
jgi:type II secretory pathway predicted ATPase ExeA